VRLPRPSRGERWLALALLLTLPLANPYIRGEGNGHYAYLRSAAVDGDLHFENEYRRGDPDFVTSNFRRSDGHLWPPLEMPTGYVRNQWPSGAAVLWAPAFLQVHALMLSLDALGARVSADGYALAYRLACAVATVAYTALGLLLACRVASRRTSAGAALAATAAVWLGSSLPVYMYFLPFYGHALAAFAAALFLWWWLDRRPAELWLDWLAWGAAAGLLVSVDHFAAPLLIVPLGEWISQGLATRRARSGREALASSARRGAAFLAGAALAAAPELLAKWILHGSPLRSGRLTHFYWDAPRLWDTGFSTQHGLFLWTPLLLAAVAGLAVLARRAPRVGGPLLLAFALDYYAVACYELWHGSSSFGSRFFVPFTPVFVIGLAALLDAAWNALRRLAPRPRLALLGAPIVLLVLWNAGLMFQWGTGLIPRQGPVDMKVVARNQVSAVPGRIAGFALRYLRSRQDATRTPVREVN
jgi:hypothetical protein